MGTTAVEGQIINSHNLEKFVVENCNPCEFILIKLDNFEVGCREHLYFMESRSKYLAYVRLFVDIEKFIGIFSFACGDGAWGYNFIGDIGGGYIVSFF